MCSNFQQKMENYQGDLADIVRASGGATTGSLASNIQGQLSSVTDWQQFMSNQVDYPLGVEEQLDEFGDPFCNTRDPLLHELDMTAGSCFFNSSNTSSTDTVIRSNLENTGRFDGGGGGRACGGGGGSCNNNILSPKIVDEEINKRPSDNIFSRMLQISPNAKLSVSPRDSPAMLAAVSPKGLKTPTLTGNEMISTTVNIGSKGSFVENGGVQISSPRSTGIKRRKSQAKKVVCIPAPTPANSRSSGEVVPSDLWAWRKYGQKPIKGSPYPRGYYRCSSSKGCSARKQVERSRTDPNMLVITYTSEHNHPWPTQRNALAGSTRSQPTKTSGSASKASSTGCSQVQRTTNLKEEQKESHTDNISSSIVTGSSSTTGPSSVKEEMEDLDKQMEMDDIEFSDGFKQSYKPTLPDSNRSEDFFADLGELEADPLNLLFTQGGYSGEEGRENKVPLDPFSFYDCWTDNNSHGNNNNNNNKNYSIEEDSNKGS